MLGQVTAAEFLVARTGDNDHDAASHLAGQLGGLPLALEQAAAYIRATGLRTAEYLALFRAKQDQLLERGEPSGYPGTVATTWSLAFAGIQEAPLAAGLLRLLAWCAPENIPIRLLLRRGDIPLPAEAAPLLTDPLAVNDAIAVLRRYSLISQLVGDAVSVHRLVQAVTRSRLDGQQASVWQEALAALITAALPPNPQDPAVWSTYAALLPHAQAVLPPSSPGIARIATYLGLSGSYSAACALEEQILNASEQLHGPDHPETLTARASLARWTGEAGDAATARNQLAALIPVITQTLRHGHDRNPGRPRQPRLLDWRSRRPGGCGQPVRRAGARPRQAPRC